MRAETPNPNDFEKVKEPKVIRGFRSNKENELYNTEEEKPTGQEREVLESEKKEGKWDRFISSVRWAQAKCKDFYDESGVGVGAKEARKEIRMELLAGANKLKEKFKNINFNPEEAIAKLEKKKIFGSKLGVFLGGMASGVAVRWLVRGAFSNAVIAGAAAGGIWEGIKTYHRESSKIRELAENQDELSKIAENLGEENSLAREKLDRYLEMGRLEKIMPELTGEKAELFKELRKELKLDSNKWKQVARGALKGAVVGAAGAYIGGIIFDAISGHDAAAAEIGRNIGNGHGQGAISEKLKETAYDSYSKTYENAVAEGAVGLNRETYHAIADKGDGFTNIARKMIHDYISEKQSLGVDLDLDQSQLVYAEDSLKNVFGGNSIHPGDTFDLSGDKIASAIEKARILTDAGKEHIKKEYVSKIGEKVWEEVRNYDLTYDSQNDFADKILESANEKSLSAAKAALENIRPDIKYSSAGERKAVEAATESWLSQNWKEYVRSAAGIGGVGAYAFKEKIKNLKKVKKEENVRDPDTKWVWSDAEDKPKPMKPPQIIDLKETDVVEDEKESDEPYIDQPREGIDIPDEYLDVKEKKVDPRILGDHLYKFVEGKNIGLDLKPGDIAYGVRTRGSKEYKTLGSFEELSEWYRTLPQDEKKWIMNKNKDAKNSPIYLSIPEPLQKYFKDHSDFRKEFFGELRKMKQQLFSEFRKTRPQKPFYPEEEVRNPDMGNEGKDLEEEVLTIKKEEPYYGDEGFRDPEMGNEGSDLEEVKEPIEENDELREMREFVSSYGEALKNLKEKEDQFEKDLKEPSGIREEPLKTSIAGILKAAREREEGVKNEKKKSGGSININIKIEEDKKQIDTAEDVLKELERKRTEEIAHFQEKYKSMSDSELSEAERMLREEKDGLIKEIRDTFPEEKVKPGEKDTRTIRTEGINMAYAPRLGMIREIIKERNAKKSK